MRSLRIAFVCNEYPPAPHGGIGTFVHTIAPGLVDSGHDVLVLGVGDHEGEELDRGVRVVTLRSSRCRRVGWLIDRLRVRSWLARRVAAGEIDLVEVPEFEGFLPFPLWGCPVVVRLHLSGTAIAAHLDKRQRRALRWSERQTLARHPHWIAVSRYVEDLTRRTFGVGPKSSRIVHYPIVTPPDAGEVAVSLPGRFLLFAGTVSVRKGAVRAAEAARPLLRRWPDLHLVYVGATDRSGAIIDTIRETVGAQSSNRVHFTGRLSRGAVFAAMARAEAFVFPSTLEGYPLVIGEAMLAGTPVVASRRPPFDEYIADGETGFLAEPEEFTARLESLLEDDSLRAQIVARAGDWVRQRLSIEACVEQTLDYYHGLVG